MVSFSCVQSAITVAAASLAYPSSVTAGNVLLAYQTSYTGAVGTITDALGNTWVLLTSGRIGSSATAVYAAISASSGSNTVTATGLTGSSSLTILEYSSSAPFALCGGFTQASISGSVLTINSGAGLTVPSGASYLAISFGYDEHTGHTWTSSAATIRQQSGSISGGESVVVGDQSASAEITFASPYAVPYTSANPLATNATGSVIFMLSISGGGGGGGVSSFAFIS